MGRYAEKWLDVDIFGDPLTFAQSGNFHCDFKNYRLENHILPSFHFGAIVPGNVWEGLYSRISGLELESPGEATFLEDGPGGHISFFVKDPNGFMVGPKRFRDAKEIFSNG